MLSTSYVERHNLPSPNQEWNEALQPMLCLSRVHPACTTTTTRCNAMRLAFNTEREELNAGIAYLQAQIRNDESISTTVYILHSNGWLIIRLTPSGWLQQPHLAAKCFLIHSLNLAFPGWETGAERSCSRMLEQGTHGWPGLAQPSFHLIGLLPERLVKMTQLD
jgi:hypothetical protein